jgi:hypothetical protein
MKNIIINPNLSVITIIITIITISTLVLVPIIPLVKAEDKQNLEISGLFLDSIIIKTILEQNVEPIEFINNNNKNINNNSGGDQYI